MVRRRARAAVAAEVRAVALTGAALGIVATAVGRITVVAARVTAAGAKKLRRLNSLRIIMVHACKWTWRKT